MGARELLNDLETFGITVALAGDKLRVRPASRVTDPYRTALRAAKPDVIALLSGSASEIDDIEMFEERAAIMEFDGGMTRAEAEAAARRIVQAIAARARRH